MVRTPASREGEEGLSQHVDRVHVPVAPADREDAGFELLAVQHDMGIEEGLEQLVETPAEQTDRGFGQTIVQSDDEYLDWVGEGKGMELSEYLEIEVKLALEKRECLLQVDDHDVESRSLE